jgi:hypothetical protein
MDHLVPIPEDLQRSSRNDKEAKCTASPRTPRTYKGLRSDDLHPLPLIRYNSEFTCTMHGSHGTQPDSTESTTAARYKERPAAYADYVAAACMHDESLKKAPNKSPSSSRCGGGRDRQLHMPTALSARHVLVSHHKRLPNKSQVLK